MIFIDASYLKIQLKNRFENDMIDYDLLINILIQKLPPNFISFELIRIYYYDASYNTISINNVYLNSIKKIEGYEDRLGTLKLSKREKGLKQKGVDTLIAIDMLSKAYQDQYDIAFLIAGDEDFSPVIDYVKNTGKRIYGIYFDKTISSNLKEKLDKSFVLMDEWLMAEKIMKKIKIDFCNEIEKDKTIIKADIQLFLNYAIPLYIYLIKLDNNEKVVLYDLKTLEVEKRFDEKKEQLSINEPEKMVEINISETLKIENKENPLMFLLISEKKRIILEETFVFDFKYDHYYKEIK